ncbi:carbohydrate-binding protein [Deinococcus cellulosilyticus]|uniref:CBM6 domain-containing protein n=1 Tax=Deinococcus cellulosilyticus (strain DSM 18568 / NBRC 106333 / KACC 11606 / 5516J-15) TaxID=1223518 RepID=A0A511N1R4_DEIC1|nr:carbohydrate-binding protein [Deinococcus cellulosilyticus]GEM46408.1 hypothetical protein DC3_20430 [Deinococcus cellulosilyticus NBRC 106333 = KACC 11606]
MYLSPKSTLAVLTVTLALSSCNGMTTPTPEVPTPPASAVKMWLTTGDQNSLLAPQAALAFTRDGNETFPTITVDDSRTYQQMEGVGAAFTDSSAYLISKLPAAARTQLLKDLFDHQTGAGFDYARLPIGASDFSRSHYSFNDLPAGQTDPNLEKFSIQHDQEYIIPVIKGALGVNPQLKIMASPWSAPGWMKTTGSLIKGQLKPEHYGTYANYFVKFLQAYQQSGISIDAVTPQNEPHHEADNYPGMRMGSADQAKFVSQHLSPALKKAGFSAKIIGWDHNWDQWNYPIELLNDPAARAAVDGIAFHCYGGDVSAQSQVHDTFPGKSIYFTECSGGFWATNFGDNLKWNVSNLLIGATRNWAKTVLLWNLALDENGAPHTGGCGNCRGVVTIRSDNQQVEKNVEYYVLGHYGKAVRPGAFRIDSNTYNIASSNLQSVAFRNPDGSKALIVLNNSSDSLTFKIKENGDSFYTTLPAGAVATYTWTGKGSDTPPPPAPARDAFKTIQAEAYSSMKGIQTEACTDEGTGLNVGYTDNGDHLVFDRIDFGATGAKGVEFRVASGSNGGTIQLRTGSEDGPVVAEAQVTNTGGWQNWQTVKVPANIPAGVQKLYVVFSKSEGINLNWFTFTK